MSNGLDSNGNFILGLAAGQGNIIEYSDIENLVNFYSGQVSLSLPTKPAKITKSYFIDCFSSLQTTISSGIYSYDSLVLSNLQNYLNNNKIIYHNMVWPKLSLNLVQTVYNLNSGTYTFVVPQGTTNIFINGMVAGGGGGGGGTENQWGGSGGSGGSSAYVSNAYINVSSGQTISIVIGTGGAGIEANYSISDKTSAPVASAGTPSTMSVNGNIIFTINPGNGGQSGGQSWGGDAGTKGLKDNSGYTNDGNDGIAGIEGTSTKTGRAATLGVQGASSIYGAGGAGGTTAGGTASNGSNSPSYGAGGGSGANADGKSPYIWSGGKGGDGYGTITMSVPSGWNI